MNKRHDIALKAWETRRRREAADRAREPVYVVRRVDSLEYYTGGIGYVTHWSHVCANALKLKQAQAERVVRNLKKLRGIDAEAIAL